MRLSGMDAGERRLGVRTWLFTESGAMAAWAVLGLVALTAWVKLVWTQNEVTQAALFVLGGWWLVGVVAAQVLIPPGTDEDRVLEGFAAAGWQAALAVGITGLMVWNAYFVDGEYVNPGLAGGSSALSAWLLGTVGAGLLVIRLRGHGLWRTLLYGMIATTAGGAWMALGVMVAVG